MPILPVQIRTMRYLIPPTVDFYYPMVEGLRDISVQHKINHQITALMHKLIAQLYQPGSTVYITGFFELKANERNVLSLTMIAQGDFGGAHPITFAGSLNFDVVTGIDYPLAAQFKPGSNYVQVLSDIVLEQINVRGIELLDGFPGIRPDQDYYIADNVLVIYFQLYEISPYVEGFPFFPIPIYEIEDIIAEHGLLQRMLGFF